MLGACAIFLYLSPAGYAQRSDDGISCRQSRRHRVGGDDARGYQVKADEDVYLEKAEASEDTPDFRCFKTEASFHLPIDDLNIPYLFVTDKNLLVSNLFIPHKEMLEQTELYLSIKITICCIPDFFSSGITASTQT